jgi:hypothetical protein
VRAEVGEAGLGVGQPPKTQAKSNALEPSNHVDRRLKELIRGSYVE